MSRCFPFPPPGYTLNGIRDEAVIKSIKGAEEKSKKEHRTKERKREKKEKKRKDREGKEGETEKKQSSHKRRRKEDDAKDGQNQKVVKESEIESLEKSSLTVERDLLQTTSQNSCDSTHNSNELPKQEKEKPPLNGRHKQPLNSNELLPKQQKEKQPLNGRHNNDSESAIRIRLPIRRQNDSKVMVINNDQQNPCPSRGIKFEFSKPATEELPVNQHPCSTSAPEHAPAPCNKKTRKDLKLASEPSNKKERKDKKLGKEGLSSLSAPETYQPTSLCNICPPSLAAQFLNVVENWVPNTIDRRKLDLTNSEDEESWWLSKKPSNHKFDTERCKQLINENNQTSSSVSWPCARLLPEADVYALPYTVPF